MWTLEKELCDLTGKDDISQALCHLKILYNPSEKYSFGGDKDWERGGAETYIYRFWVEHSHDNLRQEFIIKACVAYSPASPLDKILEEWIRRRTLLENNGIGTPKLFIYGKGVVIDEFIPHLFIDVIKANLNKLDSYLYLLSMYAGTLNRLGFSPIEPFSDLRSRGEDLVVVDFGEDLGPQGAQSTTIPNLFDKLIAKINDWGVKINNRQIATMRSLYKNEICSSDMICS